MYSATPYIISLRHFKPIHVTMKEVNHLRNKYALPCMLVLLMILLTGCFAKVPPASPDLSTPSSEHTTLQDHTEPAQPNSDDATTYAAPKIFSRSAQANLNPVPADNGGYYYLANGSSLIRYIDESGSQMVLCGQGGCTHSDSTCAAWCENIARFAARNGRWYVVTEDQKLGGTVELLCVDPASGKSTSLCRWTTGEDCILTMESFLCTDQAVVCGLKHSNLQEGTNSGSIERIALEDGAKKTIRSIQNGETVRLMGAVSAGLVLESRKLEVAPMEFDAYWQSHPNATEDEYAAYYMEAVRQNTRIVLELVDLDGSVLSTIASDADGYVPPVDGNICWNEMVIYQSGSGLYCYDSSTQEAEPMETEGELFNYFIFDGRAWQISRRDDAYRYVLTDIHTRKTTELTTDRIPLGIYAETDDKFLAVAANGIAAISKQDFYREAYDKAVVLAPFT